MKLKHYFDPKLLVLAWAVAAPCWGQSTRQLPSLLPTPEAALRQAEAIGLSEEQKAQLEADFRSLNAEVQEISGRVRAESDTLAILLAGETPDEAAVSAQFEKVLAVEDTLKRLRLKMSLRVREVLTVEQEKLLAAAQQSSGRRPEAARAATAEQQHYAARLDRLKDLIARANEARIDVSAMRQFWPRVDQLAREGRMEEAGRMLDEVTRDLEAQLPQAAQQPK